MIAFEGVDNDFVHVRSSIVSIVYFLYIHEVLVCIDDWVTFVENHIFLKVSVLFWYTSIDSPNINKIIYIIKNGKENITLIARELANGAIRKG